MLLQGDKVLFVIIEALSHSYSLFYRCVYVWLFLSRSSLKTNPKNLKKPKKYTPKNLPKYGMSHNNSSFYVLYDYLFIDLIFE